MSEIHLGALTGITLEMSLDWFRKHEFLLKSQGLRFPGSHFSHLQNREGGTR